MALSDKPEKAPVGISFREKITNMIWKCATMQRAACGIRPMVWSAVQASSAHAGFPECKEVIQLFGTGEESASICLHVLWDNNNFRTWDNNNLRMWDKIIKGHGRGQPPCLYYCYLICTNFNNNPDMVVESWTTFSVTEINYVFRSPISRLSSLNQRF